MKPPRSAIVNRFKEAQEHQKQLDAQQKRLEVTRRQILERQRLAQRREDAETAAIRFEDMISGVARHKEWPCARSDCKNPVVFHYEKRYGHLTPH
jgi:DNA repair exonuclease SbcCD ATPase subunit